MPIKGLTDTGASFPRIGELRKGAPKPETGNRPGKDLEHFRFTSNDQDALDAFRAAYGDEPDRINVFLPFNTIDENFEAWVEEWTASSLQWRGDGEKLVIWQDKDGTYSTEPKPQPSGGKETGRLKVIVPELKRLAYVVVLTTSKWDISELHANLSAYEAMRGSLQGIPFILSRVPRMISTPGGKNGRVRREKWLLHIEAAPQWVQSQLSVMKRQALPGGDDFPALEAGELIDVGTDEILDGDVVEDEAPPVANGPKPFYGKVLEEIGYFNHTNHVKATMKLLDMEYPTSADDAKTKLATLAQYATLRADGTSQDDAVALLNGELALEEALAAEHKDALGAE